jgi:large subunit ribosomal protein L23
MAARDIILRPVVTEQSMALMDDKKYTFDVAIGANKIAVKHAVEEIFDVHVKSVNIANIKPKKKRVGRIHWSDQEAAQGNRYVVCRQQRNQTVRRVIHVTHFE